MEGESSSLIMSESISKPEKVADAEADCQQPHLQLVSSPHFPSNFAATGSEIAHIDAVKEIQLGECKLETNMNEVLTSNQIIASSTDEEGAANTICCNCSSSSPTIASDDWVSLDKDSVTCSIFNITTRTRTDKSLAAIDMLRTLYKFDPPDLLGNSAILMCSTCVGSLRQLFQLYNEFLSISVLSNSLLSKMLLPTTEHPAATKKNAESNHPLPSSRKVSIPGKSRKSSAKKEKDLKALNLKAVILNANGKDVEEVTSGSSSDLKSMNGKSRPETNFPRSEEAEILEKNNKIKCKKCHLFFETRETLKVHCTTHLKKNHGRFTCKDCDREFKTQKAMESHHQIDHNGLKPHQCPHAGCGKLFRLKKKLQLHIKVMHEKNKPYPCPKCEKSFRTKYDLKVHDVGKHVQGDNSIGCSKCRRKFPTREELEKHAITHEEDKPFICEVCGKGFHTDSRLKLHSKSHDEIPSYICSLCGKAYKHKRDLLLHEVVHQDESTFRFGCGDCSRRFYRIDLLRNHQSNENHFSPEVVGPSISKFCDKDPKRRKAKKSQKGQQGSEKLGSASQKSPKGKQKARKRKNEENSKTEYLYPSMVESSAITLTPNSSDTIDLTHFPMSSVNLFADSVIPQIPLLVSASAQFPGDLLNSGDPSLSLQPLSSPSLISQPNVTTAAAVFPVSKDLSERNLPTFSISAEQIGIDVINAFINNLN